MVAPNAQASGRGVWTRLPRTLLTAFTLLLTTHCVEIDDRDLEEHPAGGGNSACQPTADDTLCGTCLKQNCCTQLTNCAENAACRGFSDCIYNCGTSSACVDYCYSQFPDGLIPYADLLTCNTDLCIDECASDAG